MEPFDIKYMQLFMDNDCWRNLHLGQHLHMGNYKASQQLFTEIKDYIGKYKIKEFRFVDFCNINLSELDNLCSLIHKNKLDIKWSAPALIDPRLDNMLIDNMKKAGCRKLIFDLFSGSDPLLEKIGMNFTVSDASRLIKSCHNNGISVGINLFFGHPLEIQKDIENTVNFLSQNLSFLNEITKITFCLNSYFYSKYYNFLDLSLHRHCDKCLELNKNDSAKFSTIHFNDCISRVASLGKPVVHTEPGIEVFDYLKELDNVVLKNKKLFFYFDRGKGHLFWEGLRLTGGLGLYTSMFAVGFWQDSEHADWRVSKISEKRLILNGEWHFLPVRQIWDVELEDENTVKLKIEIEILEQTTIEGEQQVNIMLENNYGRWLVNDCSTGFFPGIFDENWVTLFEEDTTKVKAIRAETLNRTLPSVSLTCAFNKIGYRTCVLNTSSFFNCRVLKYYKIEKDNYPVGRYTYFQGELRINC